MESSSKNWQRKNKTFPFQEAEWEDYFQPRTKKSCCFKQQIDTTDKEIDQMVYELYGLTEEEIANGEKS